MVTNITHTKIGKRIETISSSQTINSKIPTKPYAGCSTIIYQEEMFEVRQSQLRGPST